jgi:hypothetical protein
MTKSQPVQTPLTFQDVRHKNRFVEAIQRIGKVYKRSIDPEYGAALYILTSRLALWNDAQGYVTRHGIDFETMLDETHFSSGTWVLVNWACSLFNGNLHVDLSDLTRLDEGNFETALASLKVRRYGAYVEGETASPDVRLRDE